MKREFTNAAGDVLTVAALGADAWLVQVEGTDTSLDGALRRAPDGTYLLTRDGLTRPVQITRQGDTVWTTTARGTARWRRYEARRGSAGGAANSVSSPMTGKVVVVNVAAGDTVSAGDVLVVVEAMKMEQPLAAPRDGVVAKVSCAVGDLVDGGVDLVVLAPEEAA